MKHVQNISLQTLKWSNLCCNTVLTAYKLTLQTNAVTQSRVSMCTHGRALTGQIMKGNVFHFGLFEKTGTIFPSIPLTSLFIVCRSADHTQFKAAAISPSAVELTGCTEIASDCEDFIISSIS